MNICRNIYSILLAGSGEDVINPIYEGMTLLGPYALGVVASLSLFYGLFLAVKYAQCQSAEEKLNVQKTLINFIIGAGIVIVLIAVLYAIRQPLADYINS